MRVAVAAEDATVEFRVGGEAGVVEGVAEMVAGAPGADVAGAEASELGGVLEVVVPGGRVGPDAGADGLALLAAGALCVAYGLVIVAEVVEIGVGVK